ncbi:uncharacterized protein LOC143230311 isoform X2 [Tachypleus tridentatus]|uniref:uncharacterized protein LOC143230311 isoform X2 n=1 Tax=Tachypleus tridentatus TaxID=6853 RepID=UPI003FD2F114
MISIPAEVQSPWNPILPPIRRTSYSPGALMNTISDDPISLWLRLGALEKLEQVLLDGYGEQLYGKTSRIPQVNKFLKQIPIFQAKIEEIHMAIAKGQLREVQHLIDRKKLAFSRDHIGASPLHKAVLYEQTDIVEYLLDRYNSVIHARDHQGRTPLHYAAVLEDEGKVYNMLVEAGADQRATDVHGHRPDYYIQNPNQLTLQQLKEGAVVKRIKKIKPKPQPKLVVNDLYRGFSAKPAGNKVQIRELIEQGSMENLEELLLQGHGDRLLGETSSNDRIQEFLRMVPIYMEHINEVHRAVVKGRICDVQSLLNQKKLVVARDQLGATILHKAVMYGHFELAEYIVKNFPACQDHKDVDGHTALHYAAVIPDEKQMYNMLVDAGVDTRIPDGKGKPAEYYLQYPEQFNRDQLIKRSQRVNATYVANNTNWFITKNPSGSLPMNGKSGTKRRLFTGIGPEKLLPEIQGEDGQIEEEGKNHLPQLFDRQNNYWTKPELQRLEVNSANIRKWIQEEDLDKLEGAVLEGYGGKLSSVETSSEEVKNYINETVPKIMERIEAIHAAVAEGNVLELENHLDKQDFVLAKDHMGMTPLHRAVILGHMDVVEYILEKFPETVNARDKDGRTALHYAAAVPRKDGKTMFKMLLQAGANTRIRDQRGRTPEYYRTHHLSNNSDHSKEQRGKTTSNQTEKEVKKGSTIPKAIIPKSNKALLNGDVAELQEIVADGYGHYLISKTSWHENVQQYLKGLPELLDLSIIVQQALKAGDLASLTEHVTNNEQLLCIKDENGEMLVHQAVVHNQFPILQFLVNHFPQVVRQRDRSGCTALHIAAKKKDDKVYDFLVSKEADPKALDQKGRTAEYYIKQGQKSEQILTKTSDANKQMPTGVSDITLTKQETRDTVDSVAENPGINYALDLNDEKQSVPTYVSETAQEEPAAKDTLEAVSEEHTEYKEINDANTEKTEEKDIFESNDNQEVPFSEKVEVSDTFDIAAIENSEVTDVFDLNDEKQPVPTDVPNATQEEPAAKDTLESVSEEHTGYKEIIDADNEKTEEKDIFESNDNQEVPFSEIVGVSNTVDIAATENSEITAVFDLNSKEQSISNIASETALEESGDKDILEAVFEKYTESKEDNKADNEETKERGELEIIDIDDKAATETPEVIDTFYFGNEEQPTLIDVPQTYTEKDTIKTQESSVPGRNTAKQEPDNIQVATLKEVGVNDTIDRAIENSAINDAPETVPEESEDKETLEVDPEEQSEYNEGNEADIVKTLENGTPEADNAEENTNDVQEVNSAEQLGTNGNADTGIENPKMDGSFDLNTEEQPTSTDAPEIALEESEGKETLEAAPEEQPESNEVNEADVEKTHESDTSEADNAEEEINDVQEVEFAEQLDTNNNADTTIENLEMDGGFDFNTEEQPTPTDAPQRALEESGGQETLDAAPEEQPEFNEGNEANVEKTHESTPDTAIENPEMDGGFHLNTEEQPTSTDAPETALEELEGKETLEATPEEQPESNEVNVEKTCESGTPEADTIKEETDDVQQVEFAEQVGNNDNVDTVIENPKMDGSFDLNTEEQPTSTDAPEIALEKSESKETLEAALEEQPESNEVNEADVEKPHECGTSEADNAEEETNDVQEVEFAEQLDTNNNADTTIENLEMDGGFDFNTEEQPTSTDAPEKYLEESEGTETLKAASEEQPQFNEVNKTLIPIQQEMCDVQEKDIDIKNSPRHKQPAGDQSETNKSSENFLLETETNENENNNDNTENDDGTNKKKNRRETSATSQNHYLNNLIENWIQERDMIRLEHVIIAGQGERLIGRTSDNRDVQEFFDNVPTYMANIQAVHEAVAQGKLAEVKQLLTRKRFALSRDQQGASPLHLAVLHGNFDVAVYIINTFPETLNGPDNEGRTPLHYSAIIPYGRKCYEILKEAGADDTINDRSGHSPQDYLDQPGLLTNRDLLMSYKKGDSPQRSPSTVEIWHRPSNQEEEQRQTPPQDENDALFQVEKTTAETIIHQILKEGSEDDKKYLMETVGDILTYGIHEIDRLQPDDPIAYLAMWLYSYVSYKASKEKSVTQNDTRSHNKENSMPEIEKALKEQTQNLRNQRKKIMTAHSYEGYENENSIDEANDNSSFQFEDQTKMKDEVGQTVLHFAAMQSHQNDSFYNLLRQTEILLGERDENYNTVRDIAEQAGQWDNVQMLDQYIIDAFMSNNSDLLYMLMHEGYNHILNITDKGGKELKTVLEENKLQQSLTLFNELTEFEKKRNDLHNYVRSGYMEGVSNLINLDQSLVTAKNEKARCSLHIAVLLENLDIIQKLADVNSSSVHVPDNMGRTPLHYAMATFNVTKIARILIEAGALRTTRDVKMQSVSHYYIEADEIRKLTREEHQS